VRAHGLGNPERTTAAAFPAVGLFINCMNPAIAAYAER
jgi:hypothetical protein